MINEEKNKYLQVLANSYPTIKSASTEIINLNAILNLPKGTEHFISDIHGEYDMFSHILFSGSGVIKDKIDENFLDYDSDHKDLLATIIYYPQEKLEQLELEGRLSDDFFHFILLDLVKIARIVGSKYTRSKVRKAINPQFAYITEELLETGEEEANKKNYYEAIIDSIIRTGEGKDYTIVLAKLIQRLSVDHLHILGDIYDRGKGAYRVMELLCRHHSIDLTWGNHDIVYLGAALGNMACIANVIRTSCRYNHLSTLEEGYGISLRPLVTFALKTYHDDDCREFYPEDTSFDTDYDAEDIAKMHKAITIIGFKLEKALVKRHPEYEFDYLLKLGRIDFERSIYRYGEKEYPLIDTTFPTIDPKDPYRLTDKELDVIERLSKAFLKSSLLKRHVKFLLDQGSMYIRYNSNLLFHGAIPTDEDGSFATFYDEQGIPHKGKDFLDYCDQKIRQEIDNPDAQKRGDFAYFLWCNRMSPLYGKSDITTFERYFLRKESLKDFKEEKNPYYRYNEQESYCRRVLLEFGLNPDKGIIINGHMPVEIKKGEKPIKAGGRLIIIDGGMTKAYHKVTGISGYTLISNSFGMKLVAHEVFSSREDAIKKNEDVIHEAHILRPSTARIYVKETNTGEKLLEQVDDLYSLLSAYHNGIIKEKG